VSFFRAVNIDSKPEQNYWRRMAQGPAPTTESAAMSRDLVEGEFKFVGSTNCYALIAQNMFSKTDSGLADRKIRRVCETPR
jgi:3-methyladenine DNA glycosylase Tag